MTVLHDDEWQFYGFVVVVVGSVIKLYGDRK